MDDDAVNDKATAPELAEAAPDISPDASRTRVLLVEDEALIAEIVCEILGESGYEVHSVGSAEDALAHLSSGARVDLLFTDINLPGMDGATLAARARQTAPQLPVIYASGRWALLEELGKQPRSLTLQKPYSPARACEAVERLVALTLDCEVETKRKNSAALALAF